MKTTFRPPRFLVRNQLLILLRIPVQFSSVHTVMSNSLCPIDWSIRWPKDWRFSLNISPPMNIQHCFLLGCNGWIALQSKGLSSIFSNTTVQKHQFFDAQLSSQSSSHPYMTTGKTIALTRWTFVGKVTSLLLNVLSRLVITFLPRSKHLLISWLQSPSAVILESKKITSVTVSIASPSIYHEMKKHLLFRRKVMTNLDSTLNSRDITLPTKFCLVKTLVFPIVMYGCESWTVKKAEC